MTHGQKTIVCREGGVACDWEVRDADENEVMACARDHAQRRHALTLTAGQLRSLVRPVLQGVGGI